jgi:hypothetical protein
MVLRDKQKLYIKDIKYRWGLGFKAIISRISMFLAYCWVCCVVEHWRVLVTQAFSSHRDRQYS